MNKYEWLKLVYRNPSLQKSFKVIKNGRYANCNECDGDDFLDCSNCIVEIVEEDFISAEEMRI